MTENEESKTKGEEQKKNALAVYRRILRIDELISKNLYPSVDDLIADREIEASRATIFRTIEFMREQLFAPIAFDKAKNGYYYTERTYRLPSVWTTEQEMLALVIIKNMLTLAQGTPLYESAKTLLEALENSMVKNPAENKFPQKDTFGDKVNTNWLSSRFVFVDNFHMSINDDVWNKIVDAMRDNKVIEFTYKKYSGAEEEHRRVKPYQIVNSKNWWYLWCWDFMREDFRLFMLKKMSDVKVTNESFKLPSDFDYRLHSPGEFSAFYNQEEFDFKLQFSNDVAGQLVDHIWGKNQTVERDDEKMILSFTGSQFDYVLQLVLSYGANAMPLEPPELVEEWQWNVKEMAKISRSLNK